MIGAGAAGITTAWELCTDGHQVTVIDALGGIAEGASFASTGLVAPSMHSAWNLAGPRWPSGKLSELVPPPRWALAPGGLTWLRKLRKVTAPAVQTALFEHALNLGRYSKAHMAKLNQDLGLTQEFGTGVLLLLRTAKDREAVRPGLEALKAREEPFREVTADEARKIERALNPETTLEGAVHLPNDLIVNGRLWLSLLKAEATKRGCHFEMHTSVRSLESTGGRVVLRDSSGHAIAPGHFEAVVLCTGHSTPALLQARGVRWPWLVLQHCAITAPVREPLDAPDNAVVDFHHRTTLSRTGQRVRISSAEALLPGDKTDATFRRMYGMLNDWFPGAARFSGPQGSVQQWHSECAYLPDGMPNVGPTALPGVWVNAGHGARGWTFAAGCARLLADQMQGNTPAIDMSALDPDRWS